MIAIVVTPTAIFNVILITIVICILVNVIRRLQSCGLVGDYLRSEEHAIFQNQGSGPTT
jgi:hypothetical protein